MQRDPRTFLWDVVRCAEEIRSYTADASAVDYLANSMLRSAVERQFEIIGEALGQLSKIDPELARQIPHYRSAVGLRNVLIHG